MAIYRCEACGANLNIEEGRKFFFCEYCGCKNVIEAPASSPATAFLNKAKLCFADKDYGEALSAFEQVLNINPECGEAYLGALLSQEKVQNIYDLGKLLSTDWTTSNHFKNALRFCDEKTKSSLEFAEETCNNQYDERQRLMDASVFMGSYGNEIIEWIGLDKKDGYTLLLSRYALEGKPFSNAAKNVTWENSSIRAWLNKDFYNSVFSEEEKKHITAKTVKTPPSNDTVDRVFLLSSDEALAYCVSNTLRIASVKVKNCKATFNAAKNIPFCDEIGCHWWLRSPGTIENHFQVVSVQGWLVELGYAATFTNGVRPAIWVKSESLNRLSEICKKQHQIDLLKAERAGLSIFDIVKKKNLNSKIISLEEELKKL